MNKRFIFLLMTVILSISSVFGQSLKVGLRDTRYGSLVYEDSHNWFIGYEQSLLNVTMKEQSGRIYAGYGFDYEHFIVNAAAYYGTEYSATWYNYGIFVSSEYISDFFYSQLSLNGNYDSKLHMQLNAQAEVGAVVYRRESDNKGNQFVSAHISFGNIPEYRDNRMNFRFGFKFQEDNLWVKPEVMFFKDNGKIDKMRIMCSMGWTLNL